jgi:hypothetical protein
MQDKTGRYLCSVIYLYANLYIHSCIDVGIFSSGSMVRGTLGWSGGSWAYRGNDGRKFYNGTGAIYGPKYSTGDVVGCGVDFQTGSVFFTINGENLGEFQMFE